MLHVAVHPVIAAPSIFDWDVNSWPLGSLTQRYTGIGSPLTDFTFTFSGDTSRFESNSPETNQIITGGISPPQNALFFAVKNMSGSESITLTIDLSIKVTDVSFTVMDIDIPTGGIDKVVVTGSLQGTTVIPTLTATE